MDGPAVPARRPGVILFSFALKRVRSIPTIRTRSGRVHPGLQVFFTLTRPPPPMLCRRYSGAHPIIQDYVLRDPRFRNILNEALTLIEQAFMPGGAGGDTGIVMVGAACGSGTHRSVTFVEVLGRELERRGFAVKKRHLHRRRRRNDPW